MTGDFERNAPGVSVVVGTWARSVTLLAFLSACSSVPDAVNPVEWYKGTRDFIAGKDEPVPASPTASAKDAKPVATAENRKDTPKGLVADSGNAQYAEPIRREVTPTRPLARKAPAANTQVAAAAPAAAAPAAAVQSAPLPPAQGASRPAAGRADQGPDGPVAMNMTPPPPADVPETVPVPGQPRRLQQHFQQRLAESAQQVVRPGMVEMPQLAHASYGGEEAPIHLVPPGSNQKAKARSGGGKGLAAPAPEPMPAASFQVASVQFASGSKLDRADIAAIGEVVRLYKQTKGVVRVIGYAPAPGFARFDAVSQVMGGLDASQDRAEAVARELNRRGVPASKIMVAADPGYSQSGQEGAQVFLDVM